MALLVLDLSYFYPSCVHFGQIYLPLVKYNGERASRLRVFIRSLIAWSPIVLLPFGMALALPALHDQSSGGNSLPAYSIAVGNPARVLRSLTDH
jgi:hypothetical protein